MENNLNKSIEDQGSKNSKTNPVGRITMVSKTGLKYNMDLYSKEHMDVMMQNQKHKFSQISGDTKLHH